MEAATAPTVRGHRRTSGRSPHADISAAALVAGLAAAVVAQGGFHPAGRVPLVIGISVALFVNVREEALRRSELLRAPALTLLALATWCLLRGGASEAPLSGLEPGLLALGLAVVFVLVSRYDRASRETLFTGLLGVGVLVAVTGWIGVVWHLPRWAVSQDGVWRAGSTLTYSNAAAALLAPLALVLLARLAREPRALLPNATAVVLLTGLAATLSRAGALALCMGLVVLGATLGWRSVGRAVVAPGAGATAAFLGLLPSTALDSSSGRPVALVAMLVGVVLGGFVPRLFDTASPQTVLVTAIAVTAGAALSNRYVHGIGESLAIRRATPPNRGEMHEAALDQFRDSPLVGVGPEHPLLAWTTADGLRMAAPFVHDEYVQVLMELGVIGLALVVGALGALTAQAARSLSRPFGPPDTRACGALAAVVAFAVHSALDFVWHVPVLPLMVVALVALAVRSIQEPTEGSDPWK